MRRWISICQKVVIKRGVPGNLADSEISRVIDVTADAGRHTGKLVVKPLEQSFQGCGSGLCSITFGAAPHGAGILFVAGFCAR